MSQELVIYSEFVAPPLHTMQMRLTMDILNVYRVHLTMLKKYHPQKDILRQKKTQITWDI